jgi:hypothetical protein
LDRQVRRLFGSESVEYRFHTGNGELDRLLGQVRTARSSARRYEERGRRLTLQVLTLPSGVSQRDLGVLLGLSYQRVHQLVARQRMLAEAKRTGEAARRVHPDEERQP